MANQGRQKVACTDTEVMMNTIEQELSQIVGLKFKSNLFKFTKGMVLDERRRALGLNLAPTKLPHFAFFGEPGTGKSMVAGMLGKLFHMMGILSKDKVTEVDLCDLVPSEWLKRATGGILLVNNCLLTRLTYPSDYSKAVEEIDRAIIPCMESGQVVVIMAGSFGELGYVILKYVQLCNRLSKVYDFGYYYSTQDLAKILQLKVSNKDENNPFRGFKLHSSCTIHALAKQISKVKGSGKNGHIVDKMLVKAKENLDSRVDVKSTDLDSWVTLTVDDFAAAAAATLS